ncbi:hypothetical protein [Nocardioides sp. NPDC006273]
MGHPAAREASGRLELDGPDAVVGEEPPPGGEVLPVDVRSPADPTP